jgi:hypothetical protein
LIGDAEIEKELGLISIEQEAKSRYAESESDHTQMVAQYDRYHHYMFPPQVGNFGSGDQWPTHQILNPDKIHMTVNFIQAFARVDARIQSILPRVTIPTARMPQEQRDLAEVAEQVAITWLEDSGWDVWLGNLNLVRSVYGKGVLKPYWNKEEDRGDVYVIEQPQNLRIGWGRSDFSVMDWALYESTMSVAEARRRYPRITITEDERDPKVLNVLRLYDNTDVNATTNTIPAYRMPSEYEQKHLRHWDYWYLDGKKVMNVVLLNGTVVEKPKHHPEMPAIPYIVVENDHEMGSPDGVSTIEPLIDLQVEFNRLLSHAHQHVADTVDPAWYARGESDPGAHAVPRAGELIYLGTDGAIEPIQTGTNTVPFLDLIRDTWNSAHRLSGLAEILFGQSSADTSGRANTVQIQSAANRIDQRRKTLYLAITQLLRFWFFMAEKVDPHFIMADGTEGSVKALVKGFRRWVIIPPELTPRDLAELAMLHQGLVASGLSSARTAMDAIGIEAPEAEVERIKEERSDIVLRPDAVQQTVAVYPIMLQVQQQLQMLQQQVTGLAQQGGGGMSPTAQGQQTQNVGQQQAYAAQPSPIAEDQNQPMTTTGSPPPATGQGPADMQTLIRAGGAPGGQALNQLAL